MDRGRERRQETVEETHRHKSPTTMGTTRVTGGNKTGSTNTVFTASTSSDDQLRLKWRKEKNHTYKK